MANTYAKGQKVRLSATFRDDADDLGDPTAVVAKVIHIDDKSVTTYTYGVDAELVRDSLGAYHVDYTFSSSGAWAYRFEGTGVLVTADEERINVEASSFP